VNFKSTRNSLTVTLAATFLVLCTGILVFIVSFEIYFQYSTQKNVVSSQQQIIAKDAANTVKNFIQNKTIILETTSKFSNLSSATSEQLKLNLEKLLGKETSFRQLVIFDKMGEVQTKVSRLSSFEPSQLEKAVGRDFLSSVQNNNRYISPVYIDKNTSEPLVVIFVPIQDIFNDYQGSLAAEVNLKFMWDLVVNIKIGKTGQAFVVDKRGNLLAYNDIGRVLAGENLNKLYEVGKFINGVSTTEGNRISKGIRNTQVVTSYAALGTPDWAVVVELPIDEAYEPLMAVIKASLVIVVMSLFVVIIVSNYLSKKITNPLVKLRDASLAISQGHLDAKIDVATNNEIGELATAFNEMAARLKGYYAELEKKVEERTAELEKAKKSLEENVSELERMNKLMVDRELTMVELKKQNEELKNKNNLA
jgi:methyl-accepting chemotaxis protein